MSKFRWFIAAVAAVAFLPVGLAAQDTGTVTGTVTDEGTGNPLGGVQVFVEGTNIGTLSGQDGSFNLSNVPAGEQEVRATILGYTAGTQNVTVQAGEEVAANFALSESAVEVEGFIINPITGREQRTRELGTNTGSISIPDLNQASITSFSDVLSGRVAGVNLQQTSGSVGTSQRIRIRGANSLSLSNEPLIYIDGVRASNASSGPGIGGQNVSRLNDLNPNDIQNIEILKGPAASSLYGTAAANGVILITTRRGRDGTATWNAYVEGAQVNDVSNYQANWLSLQREEAGEPLWTPSGLPRDGVGGTDTVFVACSNFAAAAGACTQEETLSNVALRDPAVSPFVTGFRQRYGVNVNGGSEDVRYYLGGDLEEEQGIISYNGVDRMNLRANLDADIREDFTIRLSSGYSSSDVLFNSNDNSIFSPLINGLLGAPQVLRGTPTEDDPNGAILPANFGFGFNQDDLENLVVTQGVERFTIGSTGEYRPANWLSLNANVGLDYVNRHDQQTIQAGRLPIGGDYGIGWRFSNRVNSYLYTGSGSATSIFQLSDRINSTTTVGTNFERSLAEGTSCYGAGLVEGGRSCGGTATSFSVNETFSEVVTIGGYLQQQFALDDRIFLTGSIRGDDDSAFGEEFGLVFYPSGSLSWVLSEENWFPQDGLVSNLRLRGAAGTSGLRPGFLEAVTLLDPVSVARGGTDTPAVTLDRTGNVNLRPEFTTEFEGGFELGLLNDRVSADFTYFNKTSRDALIRRRLAPSLGLTTTVFDNLGRIRNQGTELELRVLAVETGTARLDLSVSNTALNNQILELGEGVEDIVFNRSNQRHREGYPAGSFFQAPYTFEDSVMPGRLRLGDVDLLRDEDGNSLGTDDQFIGPSLPTNTQNLSLDLGLWGWLNVATLFERRAGHYQLNDTERFRCATGLGRRDRGCAAHYDPNASLEDQARFLASARFGTSRGYIESADHIRWRELSVSLGVPPALAGQAAFLEGATLTLAGRNLGVWTDYTGIDPDVNESGSSTFIAGGDFAQNEFNTQPPVRYFTARLNFTF